MLSYANKLLLKWHTMRAAIFGKDALTLKAHQTMHLVDQVAEYGPLWATSCFFGQFK